MAISDLDARIAKVRGETKVIERGPYGYYSAYKPYSSSLDLMHQLEEELSCGEKEAYAAALYEFFLESNMGYYLMDNSDNTQFGALFNYIHATAEQKACAWLKVKEPNGD